MPTPFTPTLAALSANTAKLRFAQRTEGKVDLVLASEDKGNAGVQVASEYETHVLLCSLA